MGCCYSRVEKEEIISRCRSRRRYMKQLVRSRHAFSAAHYAYLRSLRATGAALLQFATAEINHHCPPANVLSPPPPPPPPSQAQRSQPPRHNPHPLMSPISDTWTSGSQSPVLAPPPPPPPSSWDFWDPFMPSSSRSVTEEEWDATTIVSDSAATTTAGGASSAATPLPPPPPPSLSVTTSAYSKDTSELAVVVSRSTKDLVGIIKELDEYFLKASDGGQNVSELLEVSNASFQHASPTPTITSKVYHSAWSLSSPRSWAWGMNPKLRGFSDYGSYSQEIIGNGVHESHRSTVERLYAWEKKLYEEVNSGEIIRKEHDKKIEVLRKQEIKGTNYFKIEKCKKEIEKLASRMMVASQAMHTTSHEIERLRESELFPQILELIKGFSYMWRTMYECHQVQTHIVQQLKFLNIVIGTDPTSDFQRQSTLQLELEVQQWHSSFCNLIKTQREYMQALTGWLRLSLFQVDSHSLIKLQQNPPIYSLCEEWQLALDRLPDKVASEGIKSFLAVVHAVVVQQSEETKQKKRTEAACKELDKKMTLLRSLECKYGPYSVSDVHASGSIKNPVVEKRAKVEMLRRKAEDERNKYMKSVSVSHAVTANNLQTGFPNVFQAMTGFSGVCMQAFESVCNQSKNMDQIHTIKMLT